MAASAFGVCVVFRRLGSVLTVQYLDYICLGLGNTSSLEVASASQQVSRNWAKGRITRRGACK